MTVVTKEMITTALHEAMIERNTYIDVENVLKPFLKGLCKITINGFYTEQGFAALMNIINDDYRDQASTDITSYIDGSNDMILDFISMVYQHLCAVTNDSNLDLSYLCEAQSRLIATDGFDKDFKAMYNFKKRGCFVDVCYIIRMNVGHLLRLLDYGEGNA